MLYKRVIKMKWTEKIKPFFEGIRISLERFPITIFLLLILTSLNAWSIQNDWTRFDKWIVSLIVGAFISALLELVYERFFDSPTIRFGLQALSIGTIFLYFFLIKPYSLDYLPLILRTSIFLGAIVLSFYWVPSIKSKVYFYETLLAGLKAFFLASLFSLVAMIGASSLLFAIDRLLVSVPSRIYSHVWNIDFALLAPLFFLSFIPWYPGVLEESKEEGIREKHAEKTYSFVSAPRSLEVLLTYIVIPLLILYTLVLILYFATNIGQNFWSDPVLEPLLLSYSIVGIVIYLLSCTIQTKLTVFFRKVFPKLIVLVMAFQLYASFRRMQEIGLTHGRYFVLLTACAALIIGLIFSVTKSKKTGWAAVVVLIASFIAITPPIDGFTLGRKNQINVLEKTLNRNQMIKDNQIVKNESISEEDMKKISRSVSYLEQIGGLQKVKGMNQKELEGEKFTQLLGFNRNSTFEEEIFPEDNFQNGYLIDPLEFDIEGFQYFAQVQDEGLSEEQNLTILPKNPTSFSVEGTRYFLKEEKGDNKEKLLLLTDEDGNLLQTLKMKEKYEEVLNRVQKPENEMSLEEATLENETDNSLVKMVFTSISFSEDEYYADFYMLIQIK